MIARQGGPKDQGQGTVVNPASPGTGTPVKYSFQYWADASHASGNRIGSGRIDAPGDVLTELSKQKQLILRADDGEELLIELSSKGDFLIIEK
jgi:hypothetical protein